ncbi:hypothetical protein BT96DRAFT_276009 [Gymnopus androsaceus JB14]|uniref:Secreted protein n=1 Tax=Gymnopus androsaceus JB14 TaxID=1447944 RepID=A0A6A4H2Q0_9AGAR|nr:hypothetical protein BT96DRAFT_276009 [Gymnopus androsaceus JB14]
MAVLLVSPVLCAVCGALTSLCPDIPCCVLLLLNKDVPISSISWHLIDWSVLCPRRFILASLPNGFIWTHKKTSFSLYSFYRHCAIYRHKT